MCATKAKKSLEIPKNSPPKVQKKTEEKKSIPAKPFKTVLPKKVQQDDEKK